jgi:hypothetical protein
MTDIVERLRSYASDDHERLCQGREYICTCGYDAKRDPLLAEAAAKIERLNRELDDVWDALAIQREDNGSFGDAFKRQADEIERMRAALREIDQQRYTRRNTINPDNAFENAISLNEKLIAVMDIARAALAQETPCSSS